MSSIDLQDRMIRSWHHKGLKELFEAGKTAKVRPDLQKRSLRLLDALNNALVPEDMNVPGWHFHGLRGKPKRYAVAVNGPWRITFGFDGQDAAEVDLEQYH
jgi:toxin HigB-1